MWRMMTNMSFKQRQTNRYKWRNLRKHRWGTKSSKRWTKLEIECHSTRIDSQTQTTWNQIQLQEIRKKYRIESNCKCIIEKETQEQQNEPIEMKEYDTRTKTTDWNYKDMIRKWKWRWNETDLCGFSPWKGWTHHLEMMIQDKCLFAPNTHKVRLEEGETILTTHTNLCIVTFLKFLKSEFTWPWSLYL